MDSSGSVECEEVFSSGAEASFSLLLLSLMAGGLTGDSEPNPAPLQDIILGHSSSVFTRAACVGATPTCAAAATSGICRICRMWIVRQFFVQREVRRKFDCSENPLVRQCPFI